METHILFFILAGLLIAILIGYSIWSARREKSRVFSNTFATRPPSSPIGNDININVPPTLNPQGFNLKPNLEQAAQSLDIAQAKEEVESSVKSIKISLADQPAASQPTPKYYVEETPAEPAPSVERETAPAIQIQLATEEPAQVLESQAQETEQVAQNIVSLYVVAPEGQAFRGDVIVQNLEALGFQFGEYQIFHRHLDNAASPVLFSVANMMQPGVFDLAKIDHFSTIGLVFFMHLPSAGNDLVNLRLMIRTVESFAQSLGGFVLNEQHELFDDASRQAYLLRVSQN